MKKEFEVRGDELPFISVIIPVYNGIRTLPQLSASLSGLDYDRKRFEVIFVDNGSTDDSIVFLRNFVDNFEGNSSVYTEDRKVGSYAARNRALSEAKGDIIAFTDADCEVDRNWLNEIQSQLTDRGRQTIIGGRIELTSFAKDHANAIEMFEILLGFSQRSNVEHYGFSVTANLATWRDVIISVGRFAELKSKGDFEWCQRALRNGYKIEYAESVLIRHPARRSLRELITKSRRVTGGQYDLLNFLDSAQYSRNKRTFKNQLSKVIKNKRFPHWHQKTCILIVSGFVALAKCYEMARLRMGGSSERR